MAIREEIETITEVIEFNFCYDKDKLWISILSLAKNKIVENKFKRIIQQDTNLNKLCCNICKEIDDIFNIEKNKNTIINIIKAVDKNKNTLPIITVYWALRKEYDNNNTMINSYPIIMAQAEEKGLKYIQGNNEYSKLCNYVENNGQDFINLGSELYYIVKDMVKSIK